jgi:hypothetical protein
VEPRPTDHLEIEYSLTFEDVSAFSDYISERWFAQRKVLCWFFGLGFVPLFSLVIGSLWLSAIDRWRQGTGHFAELVLPTLACVAALTLIVFSLARRSCSRLLHDYLLRRSLRQPEAARLLQPRRLRISPEGLSGATADGAVTYRWEAVQSIEMTADHAIFMVGERSGFIVPQRVFRDEDQLQAFVDRARQYRADSSEGARPSGVG